MWASRVAGWLSGPLKRVSRGRRARYRPRGRTACGRGGSCVHSGVRGPKGLAGVKAQPWTRTGVESATVGSEQRRASDSISSTSLKHPFGGSLGACQGGSRGRGGGVRILDALPLGAGASRSQPDEVEGRGWEARGKDDSSECSWREGVSVGRAGIAG